MTASQLPIQSRTNAFIYLHQEPQRGKQVTARGQDGGAPQPLAQRENPQNQTQHRRPAHRKRGSNRCTEPYKVTWVGQTPGGATPPQLPSPQGTGWSTPPQTEMRLWCPRRSALVQSPTEAGRPCLELRLHSCAVLGGGMDRGTATRAGHLLPGLLITGFRGLKVHSFSRWEMPEG